MSRPVATFLTDIVLAAATIAVVWWVVVSLAAPPSFILPPPDRVVGKLVAEVGFLAENALVTLIEILLGLVLGIALGMATALAMALMPPVRSVLRPLLIVSQALPVFAIAPLLVIWFGYGLASKVVMATLIIYFPVASAYLDGLSRTDDRLLDLARLNRASLVQTLVLIRMPSALPSLLSGVRVAATVAPIGAIVGEWVGASAGLGFVMLQSFARMQTDTVFAALILLAGMALALRLAVDIAIRRLAPWNPEIAA